MKKEEPSIKKDIKPIHPEDLIRAIRFTIKASTCLNDIDELSEGKKYFKFGFKGACNKWASFIESHTSEMMKEYAKHDENALNDVYSAFDNALKDLDFKTKERTVLVKLYCKLQSILFDLNSMEYHKKDPYNLFMYVNTRTFLYVIDKQYGDLKTSIDKKGRNAMDITLFLNNLGNSILSSDGSDNTNE